MREDVTNLCSLHRKIRASKLVRRFSFFINTQSSKVSQVEYFRLTNLGALSIDEEGTSPYKFAGSYLAVQTAQLFNIFSHNIFTVNGRLYWTVEYSPEITTRSQAEEFVDLSLRILMGACTP